MIMKKQIKKVKCNYCGCIFDSDLDTCPHCGAPNENTVPLDDDKSVNTGKRKTSGTKKKLISSGAVVLILLFAGIFIRTRYSGLTEGYYKYKDSLYYYSEKYYGLEIFHWYQNVSGQWIGPYSPNLMPEELMEPSSAKLYRITDAKRKASGYSDFKESIFYQDIQTGSESVPGYYKVGTDKYYHDSTNVMMYWYLYQQQTWKELGFSELPEELKHSSLIGKYEYVPDWDTEKDLTEFKKGTAK